MTSSEIDTLTDRLVSRIFTSDYPDSFKLATSAPTGYSTYLHNVFEDTRTDGHSQHYSIYRRDTMSAPTEVKPLTIKRSLGVQEHIKVYNKCLLHKCNTHLDKGQRTEL